MTVTISQANVLRGLAEPGAEKLRHARNIVGFGWSSWWDGDAYARSISPTVVALLDKKLVEMLGDQFPDGSRSQQRGEIVLTEAGRKWVQEHPR
jgi:hypothetical protein